jgi:hypothetical protein
VDKAAAIAADPLGDCYVTGFSTGTATGRDFLTIKYNPGGDTLWTQRTSGPGNAADQATAIAYGPGPNVYATGYATVGSNTDFLTIRYRAGTGETLWTRRYDGVSSGADQAAAIATDGSGGVYVAGYTTVSSHTEAVLVKYDSLGAQQWVCRIPSQAGDNSSVATALAVGRNQSACICGWMRAGAALTDYFAARVRPAGDTAWVRTYTGAPAGFDTAYAIALDNSGDAYVTGGSQNSTTDYDYATVKYDSLGNLVWVSRYDGTAQEDDVAAAIAVDSLGRACVTGYSFGTGNHYEDYATVRYSPTGETLWVRRYHGGSGDDDARALGLDRAGGVYVTGFSESNNNGDDIYTVKYDSAGNEQWSSRYNYTPPNRDDEGVALVVPANGTACVTGYSYSNQSDTDYVTIRYLDHDVGIVAIIAPVDTQPPQPVVPQVRIYNYGVRTETVTVYVRILKGASQVYSSSAVTSITANNDYDLTFPVFIGDTGLYVMRCSTALAGDMNPVNDTLAGCFRFRWTTYPFWLQKPDVPAGLTLKPVKDGGALCYGRYASSQFSVFALKGNNTNEFFRYHVNGDTWHRLESIPYTPDRRKRVKKGGDLCYDRYDTLVFAFKGGNTQEFWRYDVIHDSWSQKRDVPYGTAAKLKRVNGGAGLALYHNGGTGDDYVYALKGNKTFEFWRYYVQADTWEPMADVPHGTNLRGMGDGSCLVNAGGTIYALRGSYNDLYAYDIGNDTWATRSPMPFVGRVGRKKKAKLGTDVCYSGGVIYALKGSTCEFWGYYTDADMWTELDSMPRLPSGKPVKGGGALAFGGGLVWALKGNKTVEFWSYDPGSDFLARRPMPEGVSAYGVERGVPGVLLVTPNPVAAGFADVHYSQPGPEAAVLRVFDMTGRCVHSSFGICHSPFRLDVRSMPAGVYVVQLTAGGYTTMRKLIVQR